MPDFSVWAGKQPGNLLLSSPGVYDLPQRSVGGKRKQVARIIKGPRAQRAGVLVFRHAFRTRRALHVIAEHLLRERVIFAKKKIDGRAVLCFQRCIAAKIRNKVAALFKILVARGALLPVPSLLVNQNYGRK